ncbi:MAG: orotate phosphoribosyltransferase [Oligoflexia bacterium]|nr:orotate phosphoribosyltransferase [Oligoflexia bacterium]
MTQKPNVLDYQARFIDFLVSSGALTFGDFVTKSGRKTPYFINTGNFNDGSKISQLGAYYAAHLVQNKLSDVDIVFGPAYKGIPLCVATTSALALNHNFCVGFSFDRKEVKDHGDGGKIVGKQIKDGARILIVEDVITAGTTLREVVPFLKSIAAVDIKGVVIAVDRCEKGAGQLSAVQETQENLGLPVFPIVSIHHIVSYLASHNKSGLTLSSEMQQRIAQYLETYGA